MLYLIDNTKISNLISRKLFIGPIYTQCSSYNDGKVIDNEDADNIQINS